MEGWKSKALETFPELETEVRDAHTPYMLWADLTIAFEDAYRDANQSLIERVYGYSEWCCQQPRGDTARDDLMTCVAVCFYEHIPQIPKALADLPRWFSRKDVEVMREVFSYHVGDDGYQRILEVYEEKKGDGGTKF